MPPQGKLPDSEIADLATWVKAGAVWPETDAKNNAPPAGYAEYKITPEQRRFWAFQPVRMPAVPEVKDPAWSKSPLDRFIFAKLQANGLKPVRPADRRALIRRVTFDLTGLPPTPAEVDAFVADRSPDAFAKVVDRLLASPHYGERWARHWLDVSRYADGDLGASKDTPFPNAYRYRDWVIRAINADVPYDLFVKAQLRRRPPAGQQRSASRAGLPCPPRESRRPRRRHHARLSRADRRLRAVSRSQIRSDPHQGLLFAAWRVPQQREP